jgi:hypothetical protein
MSFNMRYVTNCAGLSVSSFVNGRTIIHSETWRKNAISFSKRRNSRRSERKDHDGIAEPLPWWGSGTTHAHMWAWRVRVGRLLTSFVVTLNLSGFFLSAANDMPSTLAEVPSAHLALWLLGCPVSVEFLK